MVPNQPTDKNAKFPNRGVALIHPPFGIVASGVSHHPSPPQPASESAACELPVSCLGKSAIWMCNRAALLDLHYKLTWPKEWAEN